MHISRRVLLTCAASSGIALGAGPASAADSRMGDRFLGKLDASVAVTEYFSLTCTHCAAFQRETLPRLRTELIEPGKLRIVYGDFPLDQVALTAAMVARALPAERYEGFISALFASQDRWAFNKSLNSTDELAKMALLAGLSRDEFNKTISDDKLRTFVLEEREEAQKKYGVDSTPSFIVNGKKHAGAVNFETFRQLVAAA